MAFLPSEALADFTTTIKNTFITVEQSPTHLQARRRSVPHSSRFCYTDDASIGFGKLCLANMHSDVSNCPTEAYSCSDFSGTRTPESMDDLTPANSQIAPPPSFLPGQMVRRLNSKAAAFQPQVATQEPSKDCYKKHIAEVIRLTRVAMTNSEHVASVETSEDASGWSIIIQPKGTRGDDENNWQSELLMTQAKEALLDAATSTRSIYVMGYCNAKPFTARPLGFEATLGAMQNATSACWHVFKKGFCRHGDDCCKQHPGCLVPVRVIVEGVQFKSDPRFADIFKEQVADLALTVTAACGANSYVEQAEAFKDKDYQGWTIELTPIGEMTAQKDYLLTVAKNAIFSASRNSGAVYIMGYAAKPFFEKSGGFVTMIGDMQDESRVCWDFYSKGCCSRDCACRYEHTECLMPINVVVKEKSYPISLNTLALDEMVALDLVLNALA